MASLKSFLSGAAPTLGVTPATLYERQRALVGLGVLTPIEGRGRGSGVPFTAENFAAVLISLLATDSLSEVNKNVVALCRARPSPQTTVGRTLNFAGNTTFKAEVGRALSGERLLSDDTGAHSISVSRPWRGQITVAPGESVEFATSKHKPIFTEPITITAEIEYDTLRRLVDFTSGALSLSEGDDDE